MVASLVIRDLEISDFDEIGLAFENIGWQNRKTTCEKYYKEQADHKRSVFVARMDGVFCAYATLKWQADYSLFLQNNIPEISDLNVLPDFRHQGIATKLICLCEDRAKAKDYNTIGLGVGMTADYGSAQRLYVRLGYVPDGQGLHYKEKALSHGDTVVVDDYLVLYFLKTL